MKILRVALEELSKDPKAWVGFDLDGTMAKYTGWKGIMHIGEPIEEIIELMKLYLKHGIEVRVFTARVSLPEYQGTPTARGYIESYCLQHVGQILKITNEKDMDMICLYDDRCRQVVENTGEILSNDRPGLD